MNIVCCTRIEQMKEDALAGLYADWFAMAQHFVVKRRGSVHNFEAVIRRWSLSQILHADEFWIPLMRRDKDLLVISTRIVFGIRCGRIQTVRNTGSGVDLRRQKRAYDTSGFHLAEQ